MASRLAGVLAVIGGTAWFVRFVLIWRTGGTNTTDGLVGVLFDVGLVTILAAAAVWAWHAPRQGVLRHRPVALVAVAVGLFLAVNLPILVGWALIGQTWVAEELGIVLVAVAAVVCGIRWVTTDAARRGTTA